MNLRMSHCWFCNSLILLLLSSQNFPLNYLFMHWKRLVCFYILLYTTCLLHPQSSFICWNLTKSLLSSLFTQPKLFEFGKLVAKLGHARVGLQSIEEGSDWCQDPSSARRGAETASRKCPYLGGGHFYPFLFRSSHKFLLGFFPPFVSLSISHERRRWRRRLWWCSFVCLSFCFFSSVSSFILYSSCFRPVQSIEIWFDDNLYDPCGQTKMFYKIEIFIGGAGNNFTFKLDVNWSFYSSSCCFILLHAFTARI